MSAEPRNRQERRAAARQSRRSAAAGALRLAQRVLSEQDQEAGRIASAVYQTARVWAEEDGPASVLAPVTVSAESAAPYVARQLDLGTSQEVVEDVAAFLVYGWLEMIALLTPEDYRRWKDTADAREAAAGVMGEVDERSDRGGPRQG